MHTSTDISYTSTIVNELELSFIDLLLLRNIAEDVNATLSPKIYCQRYGKQLRATPTVKELKEKLNRKIKRKRKGNL
jgi:hypothetical protein